MAARLRVSRPTATPRALAPWIAELARTLPGLAASYIPGVSLDARTRQRVILAVTEVNGCRYSAWIHGGWEEFLGDAATPPDDAVLEYARACAEAGRPLAPELLADVLPPDAVRAVRATVAQIEIANLAGNSADALLARASCARLLSPASLGDAAIVVATLPLALPVLGFAAALRAVTAAAPPRVRVEQPPMGEANLLTDVLAQALPAWLANAAVRQVVVGLPFAVSIGVRAGLTASTVTVGRGAARVDNGITPSALVVVEGEIEPLLAQATGALVREIGHIRIRPT